jgi:hypothetical protein
MRLRLYEKAVGHVQCRGTSVEANHGDRVARPGQLADDQGNIVTVKAQHEVGPSSSIQQGRIYPFTV